MSVLDAQQHMVLLAAHLLLPMGHSILHGAQHLYTCHVCTCTHFHRSRQCFSTGSRYYHLQCLPCGQAVLPSHHITCLDIPLAIRMGLPAATLEAIGKGAKPQEVAQLCMQVAKADTQIDQVYCPWRNCAASPSPSLHVKHPICCVVSVITWQSGCWVKLLCQRTFGVGAFRLMHNHIRTCGSSEQSGSCGSLPTAECSRGDTCRKGTASLHADMALSPCIH